MEKRPSACSAGWKSAEAAMSTMLDRGPDSR
jgi:hypothetical protein